MAHAATALRWQYGEIPAVVTSIGPGAMQAIAGSLAAASNGVGVYHIYGDETTFGEGYNMQQVPKEEQGLFGQMTAIMGRSYVLHTPAGAARCVAARLAHRQPSLSRRAVLSAAAAQYPAGAAHRQSRGSAGTPGAARISRQPTMQRSMKLPKIIAGARTVAIKAGGGTRGHDAAVRRLAEAAGAAVVLSPGSTGVLPDAHAQNMHVGGSKGSISGNYAMAEAELLIVIGSRAVCQADCSGIGYKKARQVININGDFADAAHYNRTPALPRRHLAPSPSAWPPARGRAWRQRQQARMARRLRRQESRVGGLQARALRGCADPRRGVAAPGARPAGRHQDRRRFRQGDRRREVLRCRRRAGQRLPDRGGRPHRRHLHRSRRLLYGLCGERAARFRAWRTSRATASPSRGDGSFMMNPQILIDGVEHGVRGTIVIFDNRRMAAITGLQVAQYGTVPHQRWRRGRLRALGGRRRRHQCAAWRLDRGRAAPAR